MSNSKKIVVVVVAICLLSLLATLNLIRQDRESRSADAPLATSDSGEGANVDSAKNVSDNNSKEAKSGSMATESRPQLPAKEVEASVSPENQKIDQQKTSGSDQVSGDAKTSVTDASVPTGGSSQNVAPATKAIDSDSSKRKIKFPGIDQNQGRVMVRDIRHQAGEGDDQVTVTLTVTDNGGEASGRVWIIGEYVQRGTTGLMFMPSHQDLNLSADGKPQNPSVGQTFAMRSNTEKNS